MLLAASHTRTHSHTPIWQAEAKQATNRRTLMEIGEKKSKRQKINKKKALARSLSGWLAGRVAGSVRSSGRRRHRRLLHYGHA